MKEEISKLLYKPIKNLGGDLSKEQIQELIEIPKDYSNGDFAFPCFFISKQIKENPHEIAIQLRQELGNPKKFEKIQTVGPYLNFFINRKDFSLTLIKQITKQKDNFGSSKKNKGEKIMIEFPSPNTNKPLHLGHLRNMSIGESVSRLLEFSGAKVIRANLYNDRGIHICKSMLAYKKWGKNKKPSKDKKPDHFVGDYYVLFSKKLKENKNLEKEAQEMLKKWEEKDKETLELWKKINSWTLKGFKETYEKLGIKFDKNYFESDLYNKGKKIILEGLKKRIFEKEKDGSVVIGLTKQGLGKKTVLRSDGTSIYITQDIYLASKKFKDYRITSSIYVTGNEQDYHFNVLFQILSKLKITDISKLHHLSYGMVNLPEGKMKSREGTVVDADNLIATLQKLIRNELKRRSKLSKKEIERRSLIIALSAIKYFLLKVDINKNMFFNPKESISFEGDTGPYLLYSYARAKSIIRKYNLEKSKSQKVTFDKAEEKEFALIKKISEFPQAAKKSYEQTNPSVIANYSYDLAQTFNEFYHKSKVIGSDKEYFRIQLVEIFTQTLKNSLGLLGIETLEEM